MDLHSITISRCREMTLMLQFNTLGPGIHVDVLGPVKSSLPLFQIKPLFTQRLCSIATMKTLLYTTNVYLQ